MSAPDLTDRSIFPFLKLSGEVRNQIYRDIIGPKLPRPVSVYCEQKWEYTSVGEDFWPDRRFNTALFFLNRQINREFSDILWDILGVEWNNDHFKLDRDNVARFVSMKRLQRCKLILGLRHDYCRPSRTGPPISCYDARHLFAALSMDIELTVFGLAHKLNQMPHLKEVHLEYNESDGDFDEDFFLRYRDGSLIRYSGDDLKTVFADDLRGMKVQMSGTLCGECAALVASAMERPKEVLSDLHAQEPDRCIPIHTLPQWSDKHRGWI
ncbi:MAG: hypothetical protein LQ339_003843 [Xanthoria mediterranea]|nr:MAG: hypothetical protein LQ339_003843 [Xanthoria mediterranea]